MSSDLADMYRNHPVSRTWRFVRYKLCFRNVAYAGILFLTLCGLYYTLIPRDSTSLTFPPESHTTSPSTPPQVWEDRATQVKQAFLHAYHGYEKYAAPNDELKPLSNGTINNFNGWGVSVFDSLDTMFLMGLDEEFKRALPFIQRANFSLPENAFAPFFETVIRYLGGLLSAYALSNEPILLARADELAEKLDPIFQTKSGFPLYAVNTDTGITIGPEVGILAEMASLQLEYTYLAKLTGKKSHFHRANTVMKALAHADVWNTGGMLPIRWNLTSAQPYDARLSVGAQADSAHEYLLKQYLMTSKTDQESLEMYIRATTHIITNLLYISPTRHLLYVTDTDSSTYEDRGRPTHIFEHLSCFLPGLLALGAHTLPLDNLDSLGINLNTLGARFGNAHKGYKTLSKYNLKEMHLWAAEGLAQTCWLTYADQPTGLGPDIVIFKTKEGKKNKWGGTEDGAWGKGGGILWMDAMQSWKKSGGRGVPPGTGDKMPVVYSESERLRGGRGRDYAIKSTGYLLRPETVESLYIMWRVTGDARWRERGWKIFQAIEKETKTQTGYASVRTVERSPAVKEDDMPSYFLAETLKYLYLLFTEDVIPLDRWVFNTEAHPFPVFEWSEEDKDIFGI